MQQCPRAASVLAFLALVGCGGLGAARDDLDQMRALANLRGTVRVAEWSGAPIVVAVLGAAATPGAPLPIIDFVQTFRPGEFTFLLDPGRYRVIAFVDENRDLEFQPGERVAPFALFQEIEVGAGLQDGIAIAIEGPASSSDERMPEVLDPTGDTRQVSVGTVLPLTDARFGPAAGRMGVFEPTRFMREVGAGVFLLEPHDPARTPVLFVHGISGYPQEFTDLVARLDHTRFEPWVAQYPSGWDLEEVAQP